MEEIQKVIKKINSQFLFEAKSALTMISDMAIMEKYIAESYDQRIIVELLQNADDSKSTNIKCCIFDNYFIFANNGREFTESDIISISRSGASQKTEESIGFRGIGFKSVVSVTDEILIYSNNTYFSFSKRMTADSLNLAIEKIPTIRVPFFVHENDVEKEIRDKIISLVSEGYNTTFVLKNCKRSAIKNEIDQLNKNSFLFLRNIIKFESDHETEKRLITIKRFDNYIELIENHLSDKWTIFCYESNKVSLAFLVEKNIIVPCNEQVAKLSCFLPTTENSPLACVINANFITDPSRKHLQKNKVNDEIVKLAGQLFSEVLIKCCNGIENHMGLFSLISERKSYNEYSDIFYDELNKNMKAYVNIKNLQFFSNEFDQNEILYFKEYFKSNIIASNCDYSDMCKFLSKFAINQISNLEIFKLLTKKEFVEKITEALYFKIVGLGIKKMRTSSMLNKVDFNISEILSHESKICLDMDNNYVKSVFIPNVEQLITKEELQWLCNEVGIKLQEICNNKTFEKNEIINKEFAISKWRTAEQQCIDIELSFGNKAIYIGNKNLGYDVESIDRKGKKRYIEVKLLSNPNGSFALTNNEYTCAHQNGDSYFVCLIYMEKNKMFAVYIQNPIKNLKIEKRIKQFEWFCEDYSGERFTFSII